MLVFFEICNSAFCMLFISVLYSLYIYIYMYTYIDIDIDVDIDVNIE